MSLKTNKKMVEIKGLNKWFGDFHVLKNIDLDVLEREVVVIIGASGSGKSTLLRCINFLEESQDGNIVINGKEIDRKSNGINKNSSRGGNGFSKI